MRVLVDARSMQSSPLGGVGRALRDVLAYIAGDPDAADIELSLLTNKRFPSPDTRLRAHPAGFVGPKAAWLQAAAPFAIRRIAPDVFHCPWYALPYWLPAPGVVTLHDLTFEHDEPFMSRPRRTTFRAQARHAARVAKAVLTVSEHVKADIEARYGVPPDRILLAPPGLDPIFRPEAADHQDSVIPEITAPYLLALGGALRRNARLAVASWRLVRRQHDIDLVVMGETGLAPEKGLHVLPGLRDDAWAALMARATAFVYPTKYEGFGLPGLEALASGTPVVAAPVAALPEVLGDAAEWSTELTAESIAASISRLLADRERAAALRIAGLRHAASRRGWGRTAKAYVASYRMALEP